MNNFSLSLRAWKSVQCGQVFIAGKASELWFCTRCVSVHQEFKSLENRLDVRRHLTEQSGQKPVKLCARCNRPQIYNLLQQQNRMQHPPTVHLWKGSSFEEGEEVYQIFSTSAAIFTRDILSRGRNRQQGKSS